MTDDLRLVRGIALAKEAVASCPRCPDPERICRTAELLRTMGFAPMLPVAVPAFLEITVEEALREIDRIAGLSDAEIRRAVPARREPSNELRLMAIRLFADQFAFLARLRADERDAWDRLHELYAEE